MEEYLVKLSKTNHIYLSKFFTGNNQLAVTTGRYSDIKREERYCCKCNGRQTYDEYHVLCQRQSQDITQLRSGYIYHYHNVSPNRRKLDTFMQSKNINLIKTWLNSLKEFRDPLGRQQRSNYMKGLVQTVFVTQ